MLSGERYTKSYMIAYARGISMMVSREDSKTCLDEAFPVGPVLAGTLARFRQRGKTMMRPAKNCATKPMETSSFVRSS